MTPQFALSKYWIFAAILLASSMSFATKSSDALKPLKDTLSAIRAVSMVDFKIEKTTFSDFSGEKKVSATAALSGPLFRLEVSGPQKEIIVYDGRFIWVAQYPDPDFPGPVQVLKSKITGSQKKQLILSELISNGKLLENFNLEKTSEDKGLVTYEGTPKEKQTELKKVTVQVQGRELKSIEYVDDIGNRVRYDILKQRLLKDPQPQKFKYSPPKGAQVSEA
ncbi:MAG: outer membrane lipoprotein carrier protein LolA [Bdellovibrionaceae bacterium]|nr:outer membrane lipoprotein carrier protein LolA [Pseudobdellovibrionaceae bacterium]